ncbi:MAG: porin [Paracoccaceae bacterium]|nr:porin [Paracoccaceae bacterium]
MQQFGRSNPFYYGCGRDSIIATTALVATAGVAAADVTLGGFGRVGVTYNDAAAQDTFIDNRLRLVITGTAESDSGVSFQAQTRIQWDDAAATAGDAVASNAGVIMPAAYTIKYSGFTLGVGNVSAQEATPGFYAGSLGYTGFMFVDPYSIGYANHDIGLTSAASNGVVMLSYSNAGLTGRVSYSEAAGVERTFVSADYKFGDYLVAVSHQESNNNAFDVTKLYAQGTFGGVTAGLFADDSAAGNSLGLTATMEVAAGTKATLTAVSLATGGENIGVGVNTDLGGGVSFGAGIADMNGSTYAEAGVVFNF